MFQKIRHVVTGHDAHGLLDFHLRWHCQQLVLDTGETLLKQGDVLIQRGTVHSWSVRGDEPCIIAAILIGATAHP